MSENKAGAFIQVSANAAEVYHALYTGSLKWPVLGIGEPAAICPEVKRRIEIAAR